VPPREECLAHPSARLAHPERDTLTCLGAALEAASGAVTWLAAGLPPATRVLIVEECFPLRRRSHGTASVDPGPQEIPSRCLQELVDEGLDLT
jgi:hypothetical protein